MSRPHTTALATAAIACAREGRPATAATACAREAPAMAEAPALGPEIGPRRFVFGPRAGRGTPPTMPVEQESKRARRDEAVPMETEAVSAAPARPVAAHAHENFSPELLRIYYDRIFPAQLMCRWLSYGTQKLADATEQLLHRREFSFTTGDDVYIRYLSFEDAAGLKKELAAKLPHKIDIGAIFSAAPRDHKKYKLFEPVQREMIIDIDLTDYD